MRTIHLYMQNQALRDQIEASLLPYVGMDSPKVHDLVLDDDQQRTRIVGLFHRF